MWHSLRVPAEELRLELTLRCGQSFRWKLSGPEQWSCVLKGWLITLKQMDNDILFQSMSRDGTDTASAEAETAHVRSILHDYLQLQVDLKMLYAKWAELDPNFAKKAKHMGGIRMLRQDPWENLISFICSSNNNIQRITKMVDALCQTYTKPIATLQEEPYHPFPELSDLLPPQKEPSDLEAELRQLGFGYRAKYIAKTAGLLRDEKEGGTAYLEGLRGKDYAVIKEALQEFPGVGPKVADCVCLMSMDIANAIPVDTHVWQIALRDYKFSKSASSLTPALYTAVGDHFRDMFGEYAGWAHSVLFAADLSAFEERAARGALADKVQSVMNDINKPVEIKAEAKADTVQGLPFKKTKRRATDSLHIKIKTKTRVEKETGCLSVSSSHTESKCKQQSAQAQEGGKQEGTMKALVAMAPYAFCHFIFWNNFLARRLAVKNTAKHKVAYQSAECRCPRDPTPIGAKSPCAPKFGSDGWADAKDTSVAQASQHREVDEVIEVIDEPNAQGLGKNHDESKSHKAPQPRDVAFLDVYLRNDVSCFSNLCDACPHGTLRHRTPFLDDSGQPYVIPDLSTLIRYLDIFEADEVRNVIIAQSILSTLDRSDRMRTLRRIKQLASDARCSKIIFSNDTFAPTHVSRYPGETRQQVEWRALFALALWYDQHLRGKVKIILLSEKQHALPEGMHGSESIELMSIETYLHAYHSTSTALSDLMWSLKEAEIEEDKSTIHVSLGNGFTESGTDIKTGYTEHKSSSELEAGVKSSVYIQGILRVSRYDHNKAYVSSGGKLGYDILIVGDVSRNRAVQGDLVVVEILGNRSIAADEAETNEAGLYVEDGPDVSYAQDKKSQQLMGRVIGITNRNWRSYVATLQTDNVEQGGQVILAIPLDRSIPKIRIRHRDAKSVADQRIIVRIDSWPVNSQYPNGHYVRSLGPIHVLSTEISAILVEHEISVSQASQDHTVASLKEMPVDTPTQPWCPSESEIRNRRDLRYSHTIFSIDPPNCQDIDDALSIRNLENGNVELGVHIADVSFFVPQDSATDLEARARGTTIYLADRRFDMLPPVLSERVCSLRENVDRYAVSVIWTLDKSYNVITTWFGRTVIRSVKELEYTVAQAMLDGKDIPELGKNSGKIRRSIQDLARVLRVIRARRYEKGALELESTEVKFKIGEDRGITDIIPKEPTEIHKIVEEAMIFANASVAERIYQSNRDSTLLRRHPPPVTSHFALLEQAAASRGITVDVSSNKALAESLRRCSLGPHADREFIRLLKTMATMAMSEAGYISSGSFKVEDYAHYGLALDFYTHYTSPIRRYADVVVHRELLAAVNSDIPSASQSQLSELCAHLNHKSREAKLASRDSTELFQSLYVKQHLQAGRLLEDGVICEIRPNGFLVFVPRFGIKGPVYLRDKEGRGIVPRSLLSGNSAEDEVFLDGTTVQINVPTDVQVTSSLLPRPLTFHLFDHIQVALKINESHAHRNTIYMTIAGLAMVKRAPSKQIGENEMIRAIEEKERDVQSATVPPPAITAKGKLRKQPKDMYNVIEAFRQLNIVDVRDI